MSNLFFLSLHIIKTFIKFNINLRIYDVFVLFKMIFKKLILANTIYIVLYIYDLFIQVDTPLHIFLMQISFTGSY